MAREAYIFFVFGESGAERLQKLRELSAVQVAIMLLLSKSACQLPRPFGMIRIPCSFPGTNELMKMYKMRLYYILGPLEVHTYI